MAQEANVAAVTETLNDLNATDSPLQCANLAAIVPLSALPPSVLSSAHESVLPFAAPGLVPDLSWIVPAAPAATQPASTEAVSAADYLDIRSGLLSAAFEQEEARLHECLLANVDAALCLRLRAELRRTGDFSPLAALDVAVALQVQAALASYQLAVGSFFPLNVAQAQLAIAFGDEAGHHQATLEGARAMLPLMALLTRDGGVPLLTVQRLARYASPLLTDLAEVRRHDLRLELLTMAADAYLRVQSADESEQEEAGAGYYSACRMAALSALHLGMYSHALSLLNGLPTDSYELDVPRQVLQVVALAELGRAREAMQLAQYVALLPEVMGPLGLDLTADVDDAIAPEPLGGLDLDNPEDGYQYHHLDLRLFPAAAHVLLYAKSTLEQVGFDPNDPFTPSEHPLAQRAAALLAAYRPLASLAPAAIDLLH